MSDNIYLDILKQYFGFDSFRSIQLDIIKSIASGHDTLGLMPTGGGKSITFQVPALAMNGVCLIVTPLIALMNDQVEHLKKKGIKAEAINSNLTSREIQKILDNAIYGAVKFLYVSPERLSQQLFIAKLHYMKICFITVDEAHCISQWGYDFRPSYLNINSIREYIPDVPILALTATATPTVMEDIQNKLKFGQHTDKMPNVFRMSFKRNNISYVVRHTENKEAEMVHILKSVPGSAIVYTRSRDMTKKTAQILIEAGLSATYYHAGLDFAIKNRKQQQWQNNEIRIMVATNAFGMGIDKPNVRVVIHLDCPDSLEAYFQEAGRAGRDRQRAYAVLLYNKRDREKLLKHIYQTFPPKEYIRKVYDDLAYFFELAVETGQGVRYEFNENLFCTRFRHYPTAVENSLSILQNAGYINYDQDPYSKPRVLICCSRESLYHIENLSNIENEVLTALLRYYGTLFVDFTYIDDYFLASQIDITEHKLHVALKELAHKGIIRYVPRREVPIITFTQQRIISQRLIIKKEIYEDLRDKMNERINSVIDYADSNNICRQRQLLEYFGETDTSDCHYCDVCLEQKSTNDDVSEKIAILLSDKQPHYLSELYNLQIPRKPLHEVLEKFLEEGHIIIDHSIILWRD